MHGRDGTGTQANGRPARDSLVKGMLSEDPCQRCLAMFRAGTLRRETVQRLAVGAFAPLARDGTGPCCFDCASADTLMAIQKTLSFTAARVATGNCRQEQYRLPGVETGL